MPRSSKPHLSLSENGDEKHEKQRAEQATRRKQRMAETVVIGGAKRGNGQWKCQRMMKAAAKQEAAKERVTVCAINTALFSFFIIKTYFHMFRGRRHASHKREH